MNEYSQAQGRRLGRFALIGLVGVAGAVFAVAVLAEARGTSIDPTESGFAVWLHNDTTATVVLKQCDVTCSSFHEIDRLEPGASVPANMSSDPSITNLWAVTSTQGAVLGCLAPRYNHKTSGLIIEVSSYAACPK